MKSTIFILVNILIISQNLFSQDNKIKEIEVRYIGYNSETFLGNFPFEYFFKYRKYQHFYFKIFIISDQATINLIESEMESIKDTIKVGFCDDFRIVCLLKKESNEIDTLAYGDCSLASLNRQLIKPNIVILKEIIPLMENIYKDDYLFYIQELEKLYKCP